MPRPYSKDLRERAIDEVRSGASRREVAEHFDVSPSSVINWMRHWHETGSTAAMPSGGSQGVRGKCGGDQAPTAQSAKGRGYAHDETRQTGRNCHRCQATEAVTANEKCGRRFGKCIQ